MCRNTAACEHIRACACMHVCRYVYMYASICTYTYVYVFFCMYTMYRCLCIYKHKNVYAYRRACMHAAPVEPQNVILRGRLLESSAAALRFKHSETCCLIEAAKGTV